MNPDVLNPVEILLVEDKAGMRDMLTRALSREGYRVTACADGIGGIDALGDRAFDLVLTDLKLPGQDGLAVLRAAKATHADLPVVVMTAYGSIEGAVTAMRDGAFDFITKPFDPDHLVLVLGKALETRRLRTENRILRRTARHQGMPTIVGTSEPLAMAMAATRKVARGDTTVLLTGESGTGKELFAQLVHAESPRSEGPFVAVNCAAIPDHLLESEFFGHEKGAFTGADSRHIGQFELAQGGTIFLDEIGDMDLALQVKLLRVLQDGSVVRVGGGHPIPLDVRVVAATNQNLAERIRGGSFREDLYYRLSAFPIRIPPLRERGDDITALAEAFVTHFARELKRPVQHLTADVIASLNAYPWPGNIRELQNCIERNVILATGNTITQVDLDPTATPRNAGPDIPTDGPLQEVAAAAQAHYESLCIRHALSASGGNKTRAAEQLQVSYKTLLTKIKEYRIEPTPVG